MSGLRLECMATCPLIHAKSDPDAGWSVKNGTQDV
jgi:hypothetical protein